MYCVGPQGFRRKTAELHTQELWRGGWVLNQLHFRYGTLGSVLAPGILFDNMLRLGSKKTTRAETPGSRASFKT